MNILNRLLMASALITMTLPALARQTAGELGDGPRMENGAPDGQPKKGDKKKKPAEAKLKTQKDKDGKLQYEAERFENGKPMGRFVEYYPNGKKKLEGTMTAKGLDGKYTEYYDTGKTKEEGIHDRKNKAHAYTRYAKDGKKVLEKADLKDGLYTKAFTGLREDGTKRIVAEWDKDKKFVEHVTEYHEDGETVKLQYQLNKAGERVGSQLELYANGNLKFHRIFPTKPGGIGLWEEGYENGQAKIIGGADKDGKFYGDFQMFFDNGVAEIMGHANGYDPKAETHGRDDFRGEFTMRHRNGGVRISAANLTNDPDKSCKRTDYYEDGTVRAEGNWNNVYGWTDGPFREFWPNGKPKREGELVKGGSQHLVGKVRSWAEDGTLLSSYQMTRDGKFHGKAKFNHRDGTPSAKIKFDHNGLIRREKRYNDEGEIVTKGRVPKQLREQITENYNSMMQSSPATVPHGVDAVSTGGLNNGPQ